MNLLSIVSFLLAAAVLFTSVFAASSNPKQFLDLHAILIVIGGTIAATAVSFQIDRLVLMLRVFWNRTIRQHKADYSATILELMKIAEAHRNGSADVRQLVEQSKDHFLKEAVGMYLDDVMDLPRLLRILRSRVDQMYSQYHDDAGRFRAMGKYPPAMGLMGAVLGMIALLGSLGTPGAEKNIGPAMSIALIATFYGIAFANLVIIPIGENLTECSKEIKKKNVIIVEGVRLIAEKINPVILAEELNTYLLPGQRIDYKKVMA